MRGEHVNAIRRRTVRRPAPLRLKRAAAAAYRALAFSSSHGAIIDCHCARVHHCTPVSHLNITLTPPPPLLSHPCLRYWWYKRITSGPETAELPSTAAAHSGKASGASKAAPTGPKVAVLYGSQTGTAESYAKVFAKEAAARNLNAHAVDMDDFDEYARMLRGCLALL
jgi:hypothetical protein